MNSRVSWSVEGIDPSVRERAEAAARRAGMSLSDWLNSTIGDSTPPQFRAGPPMPQPDAAEPGNPRRRRHSPAAGFHHPPDRTDFAPAAAQRRAAPKRASRSEPGVARQLNDAISRLDARLSQISNAAPAQQTPAAGQAAPGRHGRARRRPGLSPVAADQPGLVRLRRSPKSPRARTNSIAPRRGRCRRARRRRWRPP